MSDMLVVKSKIKDSAKGFNVAGDFTGALSKKVEGIVKDACRRAKDNNRKTIQPRDL